MFAVTRILLGSWPAKAAERRLRSPSDHRSLRSGCWSTRGRRCASRNGC